MNQIIKIFIKPDFIIFADSKKRSLKKRVNNGLLSKNLALKPLSFI